MRVRLFTTIIQPGTTADVEFEHNINNWFDENPDIEVLTVSMNMSERDGNISAVFFVVYDELDDDSNSDELPEGLPEVMVNIPYSRLNRRLK